MAAAPFRNSHEGTSKSKLNTKKQVILMTILYRLIPISFISRQRSRYWLTTLFSRENHLLCNWWKLNKR